MTPDHLRTQHQDNAGRAESLREAVVVQLTALLNSRGLTLGVPMESRVKSLVSIEEKLQRKNVEIESILALDDLVGVRAILLFQSDLERAIALIAESFDVVSSEDTSSRLSASEFGYQSQHFVVSLPKTWLSVPSLANFSDFVVEIQVRTLAQHIWAAASHKLQYKQEAGVPSPLRRSINRVSALLEMVDLEFERLLDERGRYVAEMDRATGNEPINVDSLAFLLSEILPPENKRDNEDYAVLLQDLIALKVLTPQQLRSILLSHRDEVLGRDKELVAEYRNRSTSKDDPLVTERLAQGVLYAQVGLAREALRREFGEEATKVVFNSRRAK